MTTVDVKVCSRCGREGARGFTLVEDELCCTNAEACERSAAKAERAANVGRCVDCVAEDMTTPRKPALDKEGNPRPGNRCVTHWRARKKAVSAAAHGKRTEKTYGITGEQYWQLHAAQGGRCFICQKATGAARRLAVDHDHVTGVVRGILCSPCNVMIGRLGPEAFVRVLEYLYNPPAIGVIGCRIVPSTDAPTSASTPSSGGAKLTTIVMTSDALRSACL